MNVKRIIEKEEKFDIDNYNKSSDFYKDIKNISKNTKQLINVNCPI